MTNYQIKIFKEMKKNNETQRITKKSRYTIYRNITQTGGLVQCVVTRPNMFGSSFFEEKKMV